ncbi:Mitochondrial inner membrane translocase subunit Tim17/Tim22/Tim23/peroxisomal protein PMP24 [Lupinus albus]|uniref:Mitochondrial inner membrane translocase subunit Tim17/Tim22/Tim23/peroxisomal protein PMP24 n=1 Tax=Lupinus albus TaxID=3870 RepID=A0A6A4PGL0_LUPAL|nr:Mitochondrial inner membrane translocase subunit Tim17/Tim22/Tim23/peroxisomal protein PMP24 [Lupinus albus]
MSWNSASGSLSTPTVDVAIDMGNPFLNLTLDAFIKIGTVAASRAVAEDTFHVIKKGSISSNDFEKTLKKMCIEGAYWGTVAGVYVGLEYGVERIRGHRDWNATIGGAITGALVSAVSNNKKESIAIDAITGAAVATAAEIINYLT